MRNVRPALTTVRQDGEAARRAAVEKAARAGEAAPSRREIMLPVSLVW